MRRLSLVDLVLFSRRVKCGCLCAVLLVSGIAMAENDAGIQRWEYVPNSGLEGQAYVTDGEASKLLVECGNGGGPSIEFAAPFVASLSPGEGDELFYLDIDIDGLLYRGGYHCSRARSVCQSYLFPSIELIQAIRQGTSMTVRFDAQFLAEFSLAGSDRAMTPLASCLGSEVY